MSRRAEISLIVAALVWYGASSSEAQPPSPHAFMVHDVSVFDGRRLLQHRDVFVSAGVIQYVSSTHSRAPNGVVLIEGQGYTLLPGLIDSHVHVSVQAAEASLQQSLRLGVTTVLDMGTWGDGANEMRQLTASGRTDIADVRTAGAIATVPGGHPTEQLPGIEVPTISRPEDAEAFVAARIAEGASYLKLVLDDCSEYNGAMPPCPTLDDGTLRALVAAAHRHGLRTVVHTLDERRARQALAAGVDGLAHLFIGDHVGAGFGRMVKQHRAFVVTTAGVLHQFCGVQRGASIAADIRLSTQITDPRFRATMAGFPSHAIASCAAIPEALAQLHRAGATILVGTDAPIPGVPYGAATLDELSFLVSLGLSPTEVLSAATAAPARAFHLPDRGEIRRGLRADLVLVRGDPVRHIDDIRNIVTVWRQGVAVQRQITPDSQ